MPPPRRAISNRLSGCHVSVRAGGFTLLEVLLATGLATTLLLALWSLVSTQTRLYTAAPAKIEESQLLRALFLQISDDLHNAIHVPSVDPTKTTDFLVAEVFPGLTGGVVTAGSAVPSQGTDSAAAAGSVAMIAARSSARPSALIGTEQALRFQIVEVIPPYLDFTRAATDWETDDTPRVPELCQISYTFQSPDESNLGDEPSSAGLTRRAIPWDAADAETGDAHVPWSFRPERTTLATTLGGAGTVQESTPELPEEAPSAGVVMHVPEVVGIAFRYFDGSAWSSWWDSLERRSLPVAIEVRLQFGTDEGRESRSTKRPTAGRDAPLPDTIQTLPPQDVVQALPLSQTSGRGSHRFVVYLTASPRQALPKPGREGVRPSSIQP